MLNPNHADIPALSGLGKTHQWVAWRYEDRGGPKPTKIPVNPRTGGNAKSDDMSTWGTYQQAADRAQRDKLGGVGLMLSEDDDLTGYDLDKCRNPQTGFIKPWAREIIGLRETYAEISPSGTGIRLWARGKLATAIKYDPAGVEAYSHGRYLTVTGQRVEGAKNTINAAPLTRAACRARAKLHAETWDKLKRAGPNLEFKNGKLTRKLRAPDAPAPKPGGIREQVAGVNDRGQNPFWKNVNEAAMSNLGAWAPVLFPAAVYQTGTGAWRVSSKNLGRNLEEDLSIHPSGIRDWGIDDQSTPSGRQKHGAGAHSPISLVMQQRNIDAVEAATWLCDRLGRRPEDLGWNAREKPTGREEPLGGECEEPNDAACAVEATAYEWRDPKTIPPRDWLYGRFYIRQYLTGSIAPGGTGKSSHLIVEALSMVSGKTLLGVTPSRRLRVWYWNLEDPPDEITRRIQAAAAHYGLTREDINCHLFVNHGRDQPLVIAEMTRNGALIVRPVVDGLVQQIVEKQIDVIIVDPFVSSHRVPENDNTSMDLVAKQWARVADLGNCCTHISHHTRKGEAEITTESSRGAKALTDAGRSVRVFNRMTEDEGQKAGIIDNHRRYYRTYIDKGNMSPPAEHSDWFKLASVDLGNGPLGIAGDSIGVTTTWTWPDPLAGVTGHDFDRAAALIRGGQWREHPQAAQWVGKAVAEALDIDCSDKAGKTKVLGIVRSWINAGSLLVVEREDGTRHRVKWVEVAKDP
jgi:hypothetical protein